MLYNGYPVRRHHTISLHRCKLFPMRSVLWRNDMYILLVGASSAYPNITTRKVYHIFSLSVPLVSVNPETADSMYQRA